MSVALFLVSILNVITPASGATGVALPWLGLKPDLNGQVTFSMSDLGNYPGTIDFTRRSVLNFSYYHSLALVADNTAVNNVEITSHVEGTPLGVQPIPDKTTIFHLDQMSFEDDKSIVNSYSMFDITGIKTFDKNYEITLTFSVDNWVLDYSGGVFVYQIDLRFFLDNDFEQTFQQGFGNGYDVGYDSGFLAGQESVPPCPGPVTQNVFDSIKLAFSPITNFLNIRVTESLTLGTFFMLPIAIALLFAIWRLLT